MFPVSFTGSMELPRDLVMINNWKDIILYISSDLNNIGVVISETDDSSISFVIKRVYRPHRWSMWTSINRGTIGVDFSKMNLSYKISTYNIVISLVVSYIVFVGIFYMAGDGVVRMLLQQWVLWIFFGVTYVVAQYALSRIRFRAWLERSMENATRLLCD